MNSRPPWHRALSFFSLMQIVFALLVLAGFYPLFRAWRANRRSSLRHAVYWSVAAWTAWGAALMFYSPHDLGLDPWRHIALAFTGAAAVAVLGARRPHVQAWDAVVLGLLAVMLLPLVEHVFLGMPAVGGLRGAFLAATLAVGVFNYVPTAVGPAALLLGGVLAGECRPLFVTDLEFTPLAQEALDLGVLLIPWLGLMLWGRGLGDIPILDQLWRDFRDRYGWFWGQRVREQYNRGAANAGLPGHLFWHGWELAENEPAPTPAQVEEMLAILQSLLKRFV
jgi:hypothetical protein